MYCKLFANLKQKCYNKPRSKFKRSRLIYFTFVHFSIYHYQPHYDLKISISDSSKKKPYTFPKVFKLNSNLFESTSYLSEVRGKKKLPFSLASVWRWICLVLLSNREKDKRRTTKCVNLLLYNITRNDFERVLWTCVIAHVYNHVALSKE